MKILVVSNYYPPYHTGGYEVVCAAAVDALRQRGHKVRILTSHWGISPDVNGSAKAPPTDKDVDRLLQVDPFGDSSNQVHRRERISKTLANRRDYQATQRVLRSFLPDLIYVWNMSGLSASVYRALRELETKIVFQLLDYWLLDWKPALEARIGMAKRVFYSLLEGGNHGDALDALPLIAISESLKQEYVKAGFPEMSLKTIPLGIPERMVSTDPRPRRSLLSGLRLLYAGRLVEEKGVQVALHALHHLLWNNQDQVFRLDIVGSGPYESRLREQAIVLGLSDRVRFLGQLEEQSMLQLYRRYHAVLAPSLWIEPFELTVIEAMAQGVPAIASDIGWLREVITSGKDGLLVHPDDAPELARAMETLARSPQLSNNLGSTARQTIRQRYIFEHSVDELDRSLQFVASAQGIAAL